MGNAFKPEAIIRAISCQDFARYVFNAMDCASDCCGVCSCRCHTDEVDIPDDDSDCSIEIESCCAVAHYTTVKSHDL